MAIMSTASFLEHSTSSSRRPAGPSVRVLKVLKMVVLVHFRIRWCLVIGLSSCPASEAARQDWFRATSSSVSRETGSDSKPKLAGARPISSGVPSGMVPCEVGTLVQLIV